MSANQYRFVTIWKIEAPLTTVWDTICEVEEFPKWWKAVKKIKVIERGDENGLNFITEQTWKGVLPYQLSFTSRIIAVDYLKSLELEASGHLEGRGKWTFSEGDGMVTIHYLWEVKTTQKLLSGLALLLKPLLAWNHDEIMRWGALGLAQKLQAQLIED